MSFFLGLGGPYFHDTSSCIVDKYGKILAFSEEERFSRIKNNKDSRSCTLSTLFCLNKAGINLNQVTEIAVSWNPYWPVKKDFITDKDVIVQLLDPKMFNGFIPKRVRIINHHLTHASSAYYLSGFKNTTVFVVDGSGDGVSTSIYSYVDGNTRLLKSYPFTQSLGWFYETIGEYLGLGNAFTASGKLMGLASYGTPSYDLGFISSNPHTGYEIDLSKYGIQNSVTPKEYTSFKYYRDMKKAYHNALKSLGISQIYHPIVFDPTLGKFSTKRKLIQSHADLAASTQLALETSMQNLISANEELINTSTVCITGGVALNCTANGHLHSTFKSKYNFFFNPISGDAGCAIGAAYESLKRHETIPKLKQIKHTYFGVEFDDTQIKVLLDKLRINYMFLENTLNDYVSNLLVQNKIIGWFQGRAEGGPRALGNRSILANPTHAQNQLTINERIKNRETWRPFAPSILAEHFDEYIASSGPSEFMVAAYNATDLAKRTIGATVHVDGSTRPQKVSKSSNPSYHDLIKSFYSKTGIPAVLNTSMNSDNMPMVSSPIEAIQLFYSTELDAMVLGSFVLEKKTIRSIS